VRRLAVVCRPVIVVAASETAARALLASAAGSGTAVHALPVPVAGPSEGPVAVVADRWPGAGPLGGLATGLGVLAGVVGETAGGRTVGGQTADAGKTSEREPGGTESANGQTLAAVVAVDMPFVAPALLARLIEIALAEDRDAVVPVVGGRAQPLCAVYAARVASVAEDLLRGPRRAMHDLLEALGPRVAYVSEDVLRADDPDLRSFFNINTLDDLTRAREIAIQQPEG
jgi:molybdopterin-guanine dinucleotide biosynthesis protein A